MSQQNFVAMRNNSCYLLSVSHTFRREAVQYRVSPYKFFRLLEYTASYF